VCDDKCQLLYDNRLNSARYWLGLALALTIKMPLDRSTSDVYRTLFVRRKRRVMPISDLHCPSNGRAQCQLLYDNRLNSARYWLGLALALTIKIRKALEFKFDVGRLPHAVRATEAPGHAYL
jgi:hypothetical protein